MSDWTPGVDPVHPGFIEEHQGFGDGFLARIDPLGPTLLSWTYVGGGGSDDAWDVVLGEGGVATVIGFTSSSALPTTGGAFDTTFNGITDYFVWRLSPRADRLFYGTFVGGTGWDPDQGGHESALAVDPDGGVVMVGMTLSTDYPTTPGTFHPDDAPFGDAVITKLTMLPLGVQGVGSQTAGCSGTFTLGVTAMPRVGGHDFGFWATGVTPLSPAGFLGLSPSVAGVPQDVLGVDVWLGSPLLLLLPLRSNALGYAELRLPLPLDPGLVGVSLGAQAFWPDACGAQGWSASRALLLTFQS